MTITIIRDFDTSQASDSSFKLIQTNSTIRVVPESQQYQFGTGTIYVNENFFGFFDHQNGLGFTTSYPNIVLHAINREGDQPNVYIQLLDGFSSEEPNEDEDEAIYELLCFPGEDTQVDELYNAICHCQTLHPDVDDEDDNEYDESHNQNQLNLFEQALANGMGADFDPNTDLPQDELDEGEDDEEEGRFDDA